MSVKPIIPSVDSNNNAKNVKLLRRAEYTEIPQSYSAPTANNKNVSFQGANPVVGLMDFIEAGGYAASFIIQDGLGFIAPRVGKGLLRGGEEKRDENGNVVLDKNGKPKHELNWAFARKEAVREIVTGPSAFLIPWAMLKLINKKFGAANNVKLNYIDGFGDSFKTYATSDLNSVIGGTPNKKAFYEEVFKSVIDTSINKELPEAERLSANEINSIAKDYAHRQIEIEKISADKTSDKKAKAEKIKNLGGSVEESFIKLRKNKIGGTVDEQVVKILSSDKSVKSGNIGEMLSAMNNYFDDAVGGLKKKVSANATPEEIEKAIKSFSGRRMGTRILTNLGLFSLVAAFYTQIPKLYNMGLKGNPALGKNSGASTGTTEQAKDSAATGDKSKVAFTGKASVLENIGNKVFGSKKLKSISDIFELNGPIISGSAMSVLLYGFCIPPRLQHAQDKYDYGEIIVRDMTAFTALLFGAKALARVFSDGFTKITGLALNRKNMEGKNTFGKIWGYLSPNDTSHSVLSSKQLMTKYTNLKDYKGGVEGFIEFIEKSGGNIKKAFAHDKDIKASVEEILKSHNGKSYADASVAEIKDALKSANKQNGEAIEKFYKLFEKENGLLNKAKTCNSAFGFVSTLLLVPGLIMALTNICEKMTNRRIARDMSGSSEPSTQTEQKASASPVSNPASVRTAVSGSNSSMEAFLDKSYAKNRNV